MTGGCHEQLRRRVEAHVRNVSVHRRDLLRTSLFVGSTLSLSGAWAKARDDQASPSLNERLTGDISPVHDPCMIKQGDIYHLFCTGQAHDPTGWPSRL